MSGPDVVGPSEACKLLGGISRERLRQLRKRPDFPRARELEIGSVWDRLEVETWNRDRLHHRNYAPGLRAYRASGKITVGAAAAGVHPKTFRDYLASIGEL